MVEISAKTTEGGLLQRGGFEVPGFELARAAGLTLGATGQINTATERGTHSRIRYLNNYLVNVLELPKMHSQPFRHPH